MITTTSFETRVTSELASRGMPVGDEPGGWSRNQIEAYSEALFGTTGLWKIALTIPSAGPLGVPSPHVHTIAPGIITAPAISASITPQLLSRGFVSGYGWEYIRDAFAGGVGAHFLTAITDPQDGNAPHTHSWLGLSASVLKGLMIAPLAANPNLVLTDPASKLEDYVEALSTALVDEIIANGKAYNYLVVGTTHTHLMQ